MQDSFELAPAGLVDGALAGTFPHLSGLPLFRLPPEAAARAGELLQGQVAIQARDGKGRVRASTSLQIGGVLDDLYATDAPLGIHFIEGVPSLSVWAPTAKSVAL